MTTPLQQHAGGTCTASPDNNRGVGVLRPPSGGAGGGQHRGVAPIALVVVQLLPAKVDYAILQEVTLSGGMR